MERNKFLVFCFAFVPGAGQMYLGMMKKGLVIMGAFWAVIAIAVMLNLGVLFVFLPIIWFYAFFDTFNSARYHADQRLQMDYKFWEDLKRGGWTPKVGDKFPAKRRNFWDWAVSSLEFILYMKRCWYRCFGDLTCRIGFILSSTAFQA